MKLFDKRQYHISQAHNGDYGALAEIHGQSFDHGWSEDEIASTMAGKGVVCLIANIHGKGMVGPRGFLIIRTVHGESEVLTLAVGKKFRKQGIARTLMEHAIRFLHAERIGQLFLEVSDTNKGALKLYHSLNFKQISERKAYYKGSTMKEGEQPAASSNALVMQLDLGY